MKTVKVTVRKKPISKGRQRLYLDFYPAVPHPQTGKPTRRHFLDLFLYDRPRTESDKEHNKQAKNDAEAIRAYYQLQIHHNNYSFLARGEDNQTLLMDYYRHLTAQRVGTNQILWQSSIYYMQQYFDENIRLTKLTLQDCNGYRDFLLSKPRQVTPKGEPYANPISTNTANVYLSKFKAALKQAFKDGHLASDLSGQMESIKRVETHRQFLDLEELQKLANTDCRRPELKKAALFSALTGMRFSDIKKLTWAEVQHSKAGGYFVQFRQQKTQQTEVNPIPETAFQLLGERGNPTEKVIPNLQYTSYYSNPLQQWIQRAGITKHITFHSFRHTFATLQLTLGTDIYTVSKMLGHRELKTTQIYAKVIDKTKQEAAGRIKLDL